MHYIENVLESGNPGSERTLILLHGRGGNAVDILALGERLTDGRFRLLAPQASNNTWYPHSFLQEVSSNEPWLSSALSLVGELVEGLRREGIGYDKLFFCGFSQGACLSLEYAARNGAPYGGIISFIGGLIGREIQKEKYSGDFLKSPVLLISSDPDPHVPASRVVETEEVFRQLNATTRILLNKGAGHGVSSDDIKAAQEILFQ